MNCPECGKPLERNIIPGSEDFVWCMCGYKASLTTHLVENDNVGIDKANPAPTRTVILFRGEVLKKWRNEARMSRSDLARKSGVATATIAAMEDHGRPPKFATLIQICDALNLEVVIRKKKQTKKKP